MDAPWESRLICRWSGHVWRRNVGMLEERSLKIDLAALALLAIAILLGLALLTYDPADPPSRVVFPPRAEVHNVCGRGGALLAHGLFTFVGLGAYYLLLSSIGAAAALLVRRTVSEPALRLLGWAISLAGVSTLAALAVPHWSPGPVIGAGGYLGTALRAVLEPHFASAGSYVLVLSVTACGLLLSTDYVLVKLSAALVRAPARGMGQGLARAQGLMRQRAEALEARRQQRAQAKQPVAAAEQAQDEDDDSRPAGAPAIKIRGRQLEPAEPVETEPIQEETSEEAEEAAETEEAPTPQAAAPGEPIRIRTPQDRKAAVRDEMIKALHEADQSDDALANYELPSLELLMESEEYSYEEHEKDIRRKARILEKTFRNFGFEVRVVEIDTGPVIAQFEVELEAGLRLSKITSLADDLAIALRVPSVRIVAPIPGKNTVGIEVPNQSRQLVRLREVMEETPAATNKQRIPIFLGKDVAGKPMVVDLTTLPHLLIAGRTGTGKSVCLNTIIMSILMTRRPDEVKMLLIDPKMVELTPYTRLPHLMHPVVTDMKKAEAILAWAVDKMEERYALLARAGVRHISVYNQLGEDELMNRLRPVDDDDKARIPVSLPYIVIVADEMADLMMTAPKEVESHIIRLAQKSRAVGIHLVLATQKPTVDVITGLIKSNLPARIAFQVASRTDSRVVLDEMGADKLLGNGDMLFLWPGTSTLLRGQGAYVSDDEINRVCGSVATVEPQFVHELVHLPTPGAAPTPAGPAPQRDELYNQAIEVVIQEGRGSVSLLQRALGIGYGRAARLVDFMAEDGIVGQYNGSQAREVLLTMEQWRAQNEPGGGAAATPAPAKPPKSGRVLTLGSRSPVDDEAEPKTKRMMAPWESSPGPAPNWRAKTGPLASAKPDDEVEPVGGRGSAKLRPQALGDAEDLLDQDLESESSDEALWDAEDPDERGEYEADAYDGVDAEDDLADEAEQDENDTDEAEIDEDDTDEDDTDEADTDEADTGEDDTDEDDTDEDDTDEDEVDEADTDEADTDEADTDEADTDEADTDEADTDEADTDEADTDEEVDEDLADEAEQSPSSGYAQDADEDDDELDDEARQAALRRLARRRRRA